MKNRVDDDALRFDLIEDRVGESADKGTMVIGKDCRIHQGMSLYRQGHRFKGTEELQTQPEALLLIPGKGIGNILPGLREKARLFTPWIQGWTS